MTRKRAERLTGYEIRPLPTEGSLVTLGACDRENLVVKASGRAEWIAPRYLVKSVYLLHSHMALKQCAGRCTRCRSWLPLQIHHRKYRSHGGTHGIHNLEPVCWECHRLIHETERSR
jgi:5-methylcytosine-specific restriction endonuclease McrA